MINIIGDTADELADLQSLIELGVLNCHEKIKVNVNFKLSSGDIILTNEYKHIVGSKPKGKSNKSVDKISNLW